MTSEEINRKLADPKRLLTDIYFELQEIFESKYGENVLMFIELGSFFEIYSVDNEEMKIGKAREVAEMLNIQLTRKNKSIAENSIKNPFMAGVPTVAFERHLNRIIGENKYTIILIRQRGEPPTVTRYLHQIISPGTNFDYISDSSENYIVALTIDAHKGSYSIGYSAIDVSTGISIIAEIHSTLEDPNYALDEVFNLLHTYKTSEIVINFISKFINQQRIFEYLEVKKNYHFSVHSGRTKIDFQNELFKRVFNTDSFLSPIEELNIEHLHLASESLAILIDFIFQHDYKIVERLDRPKIVENRNRFYLGNNAIEQLDIISNSALKGENSILSLVDKSSTAMGKRLLKARLLNPISDGIEIKSRLSLADRVYPFLLEIESNLKKIYDIERISRRIKLKKLHPFEINYLHISLFAVIEISNLVKRNLIDDFYFSEIEIKSIIDFIDNYFELLMTQKFNIDKIDENIFLKGVSLEIDRIENDISGYIKTLNSISDKISELLKNRTNKSDSEMVSLASLDKEGYYITLTANRFNLIERDFLEEKVVVGSREYYFRDFKVRKLSNNVKITADIIEKLSEQISASQTKLISLLRDEFYIQLNEIDSKFSILLEKISQFIAKIDIAVASGKVRNSLKYCQPEIVDVATGDNFLQIFKLRHPLIERRESAGIYVPNDIFLGNKNYLSDIDNFDKNSIDGTEDEKINGILLYGINSSGKSSLMKSIGIAIILAQSGFPVPAEKMRFSIFKSLFTRIVSRDNLQKGLSSFAVEMVELKNIFNRAGEKTIVLGDEISHGTETLSGVAIVSSAIMRLVEEKTLFVFATHLHQLTKIDEVQSLSSVVNLHLAVKYDETNDKLIFNRKLQIGSGSSIYGLEFARSLHMDEKFLKGANSIRKRLSEEYSDIEVLMQKKQSKYNNSLYLTKCIICGEKVDEVHHIAEKKLSKNGFIGHFSKHHKHNLIPLCKEHHLAIHNHKIDVKGFVMTSSGLELHYEIEENINIEKVSEL